MGKRTRFFDVLKNILKDVTNIQNIIDNARELEHSCHTISTDNSDDLEKFIKDTKAIVDNLKTESTKIESYFESNYKTWKNDTSHSDVNGDIRDDNLCDKNSDEPNENNSDENSPLDTGNDNNSDNLTSTENQEENETSTVQESILENSVDTAENTHLNGASEEVAENANLCSTEENENLKNSQETEKVKDNEMAPSKKTEKSKTDELNKESYEKDGNTEPVEENEVAEPKVFLKCVDINKLINPDILPHLGSPKPLMNNCDETVLIISDSDDEPSGTNAARKRRSETSVKKSVSHVSKFNDSVDIIRTSRKTRTSVKQDKNTSTHKKKKTKQSENVDVQTISSDSDEAVSKRKSLPKRKKKAVTFSKLRSTDESSYSTSDSDMNSSRSKKSHKHKKSKSTFSARKILSEQNDKKFSYKAYVPVERVPCDKLKENYLKQKDINEINRLTNLKSLKKRCRSSMKNDDAQKSSDSDNKKRRKRKRKSSKNSDKSADDLSSDSNSGLKFTEDIDVDLASDTEQTSNINAMNLVLDGIESENKEKQKSDGDGDSEVEEKKKNKRKESKDKDFSAQDEGNIKPDNENKTTGKSKDKTPSLSDDENVKKDDGEKKSVNEDKKSNPSNDESVKKDDTEQNSKDKTIGDENAKTDDGDTGSKDKDKTPNTSDDDSAIKNHDGENTSKNKDKKPSLSDDENAKKDEEKKKSKNRDKTPSSSDDENVRNDDEKKKSKNKDKTPRSSDDENDKKDDGRNTPKNKDNTSRSSDENTKKDDKKKNESSSDDDTKNEDRKKSSNKDDKSSSSDSDSVNDDGKKTSKNKGNSSSDNESTKKTDGKNVSKTKQSRSSSSSESDSNKKKHKKKRSSSSSSSESESNKKKDKKKRSSSSSSSESESNKKKHKKKRSSSSSSSESESTSKKKKKKKSSSSSSESEPSTKKKKGKKSSSSSTDSESTKKKKKANKEKSKWRKDQLLTSKLSDTDSEEEFEKFKKRREKGKLETKSRLCKKRAKKVFDSDSDQQKSEKESETSESSSSSSESEKETKDKQKRRRIQRINDSSEDDGDKKTTRKTIRKVIAHESLAETTKKAEKDEKERKARILERQKKYNEIFDKPLDANLDQLVLDFNEDTKKEILSVNQQIVKKLKPHQGKGVQFMWNACFESVERAEKTKGSGCILAHCMGLGKTLQVIALTHTLLTNTEILDIKKVLVVCPLSTVFNWVAEYKQWLSDIEGDEIEVYELVSSKHNIREYVVDDWHKNGGVLIIGYDMFRNLTNPNNKRLKKKARESFRRGLVDPGPDIVICDEGHLLKNEKTNLSVAMNRIRTVRRIVLTGTPMQNNLKEYYCMVQFVKPNLLGTYKEYINRFVNPITNGQYTDSTDHDINIMKKRSHVLHKMLDGIVQRKDYSVLTPFLPPKHEYVLFLKLTKIQIQLYQHYKDHYSQRPSEGKIKTSFLFTDFQEFQRICTHPKVLLMKSEIMKNKYTSDEDEESEGSLKDFIDDESEAKSTSSSSSESNSDESVKTVKSNAKSKNDQNPKMRLTRNSAAASGIDIEEEISTGGGGEWWREYCNADDLENIEHSSKLYLLFKILQECELIGDKLLVFSQSLLSLNVIEYFLAKIDEATQKSDTSTFCGFSGSWSLGLDYFRLDGSSSCENRSSWCKHFNNVDNTRARLFLISTKAGGLGINLVGANRVVIFDVSWNPSHDTQSIYRIYRFGQTKPCYVYRFVIWGTMEMKIYERQVTKQAISKRVIDEQQIDRHYNQSDLLELYNFDPEPSDSIIPLVPKDVLLAEMLQIEQNRIYKYHEHQSLLENKEDEELNEAERKAAWEEFENEKKVERKAANSGSLGWIKNLPVSSINIALQNIVQKDNPNWTPDQVNGVISSIVQQLRMQVDSGNMQLFQRIVEEMRQMQTNQQKKYQEYLRQQQMRILQQSFQQQMFAQLNNPTEIVELND